jgi:formylglycine-generating enzyme required for sulfatase activity
MKFPLSKIQLLSLTAALAFGSGCSKTSNMILVAPNANQGTTTSFYIDQYEASLKLTKKTNATTGEKETVAMAQTRTSTLPAAGVNYAEAEAYCELADKRICTVKEWLTACVGPDNLGSSVQAAPTTPSSIDGPCYVNRAPDEGESVVLVKTGANVNCKTSSLQVYDMIGNVSEWAYDETLTKGLPMGPNAASKVVDGKCSYYLKTDTNADDIGDTALDPAVNHEAVGFRCCLDVPAA